jgi:hypothetical protein
MLHALYTLHALICVFAYVHLMYTLFTLHCTALHRSKGSCVSVTLPDEAVLFGAYPTLECTRLTGSEYKVAEAKYRCGMCNYLVVTAL